MEENTPRIVDQHGEQSRIYRITQIDERDNHILIHTELSVGEQLKNVTFILKVPLNNLNDAEILRNLLGKEDYLQGCMEDRAPMTLRFLSPYASNTYPRSKSGKTACSNP